MTAYDWNAIPAEKMNPKITRRVLHSGLMTIAHLELLKDAVVPEHSHHNEQIATVERGALQFTVAGVERVLRGGESLVLPPNVPHAVVALEDTIVVDVFSPCREDWKTGDDAYLRK